MRLTADLLLRVEGYTNSSGERECSLRGLKVPAIENLAVMQDQFNSIDLTDNEIKKLDNFPSMKRIESLFFANNHIAKISSSVGKQLPNLENLVLTNNRIVHLNELKHLVKCTNLKHLSCLDNPISMHTHYRLYVIYYLSSGVDVKKNAKKPVGKDSAEIVLPNLKTLDFRKITAKEREAAKELFTSEVGRELLEQIKAGYAEAVKQDANANLLVGQRGVSNQPAWMTAQTADSCSAGTVAKSTKQSMGELTAEQKAQVRAAIEGATTKVEIDRIELQLQTGTFQFFKEVTVAALEEDGGDMGNSAETEEDGKAEPEPAATGRKSKRGRSVSVSIDAQEVEDKDKPKKEEMPKSEGTGRGRSSSSVVANDTDDKEDKALVENKLTAKQAAATKAKAAKEGKAEASKDAKEAKKVKASARRGSDSAAESEKEKGATKDANKGDDGEIEPDAPAKRGRNAAAKMIEPEATEEVPAKRPRRGKK